MGATDLRAQRERRGWSQQELAFAVRVSRQSLGAIEAGRTCPSVDLALRLASALDASVEDLFSRGDEARVALKGNVGVIGRVALAHIGGRWVAHPLTANAGSRSCDGLAVPAAGRTEVHLTRRENEARRNLLVMGCAPALGIVADRLNATSRDGSRAVWIAASSGRALEALAARETHLAGVHLVDEKTGEENVAEVRSRAGTRALRLITLGRWEQGIVTPRGNPKRLRAGADLGRRGLRLAVRERGSGARRLFDREVARAGLVVDVARHLVTSGHLEVGHAVAIGAADAGIATRDAAIAHGLAFVPLANERYDLALAADALGDARIERWIDAMTSGATRRELSALGYDVSASGTLVALRKASVRKGHAPRRATDGSTP